MAFKRALVVDDSKTARQSLAKLLANHDLEVAFAESGEGALDFLQHELVDVIFMDHTMPGMDGLEAVSAIKSNPRTATIPVMMYTTKEGEVYVGQARAFGAVGVLPKEVQPGVLFDMLNKLGLVEDRRSGQPAPAHAPRRRLDDLVDEADHAYEQRALNVSVQTQVGRILQEQHLKLRAEILSSHRRFAQQVAAEILDGRKAPAPAAANDEPADDVRGGTVIRRLGAIAAVLTAVLLAGASYTWQVQAERDQALADLAHATTASRDELGALLARNDVLSESLRERSASSVVRDRTTLDTLAWALNQATASPFEELPFGDVAAVQVSELGARLQDLGFRGAVSLTARLAPFCLVRDPAGELGPAPRQMPVGDCEAIGHPLQDVSNASALQSVAFATAVSQLGPELTVRLNLLHPQETLDAGLMPGDAVLAGAWNSRARGLNRLTIDLLPNAESDAGQLAAR